jgi:hypothetical protein
VEVATDSSPVTVNEWLAAHPEMILGGRSGEDVAHMALPWPAGPSKPHSDSESRRQPGRQPMIVSRTPVAAAREGGRQ